MSIKVIIAPTSEPVTLAEAVAHLRVVGTDDDAYISALIVAARQAAEHITGRALLPQTLELALDCFDDVVRLQRPPLASIVSVKYLDDAGVLTTMDPASYVLDDHSEPARLTPAYGTLWPLTREQANAVLIRYVAGYANATAVPQEIKAWMLLRIGMLYENRESVVVGITPAELPFVDHLLDAHRIWGL